MQILIVEDDAFLRDIYRRELETAGYSVTQAENGEVALALLQKERPAMIFLDILMPGRDGFDVLTFLKESPTLATIPVVVLTNVNQQVDIERAMKLGARDFLNKGEIKVGDLAKIAKNQLTEQ